MAVRHDGEPARRLERLGQLAEPRPRLGILLVVEEMLPELEHRVPRERDVRIRPDQGLVRRLHLRVVCVPFLLFLLRLGNLCLVQRGFTASFAYRKQGKQDLGFSKSTIAKLASQAE